MASFVIYIIRWAVCLTLLYSFFGLFLKRETLHSANRLVLLFVLVASMVLPFVQVNTKEANLMTQSREVFEQKISSMELLAAPLQEGGATMQTGSTDTSLPSGGGAVLGTATIFTLLLVYFAGLAIYWTRYLWSLAALLRLIRRGRSVEMDGLPKGVKVLTHPSIQTPCSWLRWVMLPPEDATLVTTSLGGGQGLLLHELAHIRLGHSWDMMLCELTCRMLWFLPFSWMLRQDLRDIHEYQADRRVLSSGIKDEDYQMLLIKKATSTGLQPVVNAFNQSPIKRRFKMMYSKPSRRWVVLKAAYLLPLCTLAVVAFARPQAMSEIEAQVEVTTPAIAEAIKTVVQQFPSLQKEGQGAESAPTPTADAETPAPQPTPLPDEEGGSIANLPDSNLVKADLAESGNRVLGGSTAKTPLQLLDSTMQAVGARKIADGTYVGHFQPNLNSDTVRIARATILDRQSRQTGERLFAENATDPYAYNITLNAETRKDRTGYYIRFLQPVSSNLRHYDKKEVDPMMLSTDSVLTKRSVNLFFAYTPAAIERTKKETRIFMYAAYRGELRLDVLRQQNSNLYAKMAIVDERTGDKYVCRATDYDYFKYVKDEYVPYKVDDRQGIDTIGIYQVCLVFPPLGKNVKEAHFGSVESDVSNSRTFNLNDIPRKGRVITN